MVVTTFSEPCFLAYALSEKSAELSGYLVLRSGHNLREPVLIGFRGDGSGFIVCTPRFIQRLPLGPVTPGPLLLQITAKTFEVLTGRVIADLATGDFMFI
jgi:hypothetical protein